MDRRRPAPRPRRKLKHPPGPQPDLERARKAAHRRRTVRRRRTALRQTGPKRTPARAPSEKSPSSRRSEHHGSPTRRTHESRSRAQTRTAGYDVKNPGRDRGSKRGRSAGIRRGSLLTTSHVPAARLLPRIVLVETRSGSTRPTYQRCYDVERRLRRRWSSLALAVAAMYGRITGAGSSIAQPRPSGPGPRSSARSRFVNLEGGVGQGCRRNSFLSPAVAHRAGDRCVRQSANAASRRAGIGQERVAARPPDLFDWKKEPTTSHGCPGLSLILVRA